MLLCVARRAFLASIVVLGAGAGWVGGHEERVWDTRVECEGTKLLVLCLMAGERLPAVVVHLGRCEDCWYRQSEMGWVARAKGGDLSLVVAFRLGACHE